MKLLDNTILITGGGSGIGRGLAEAFHAAGNKVIIAGRRRATLDEVAHANPGIDVAALDVGQDDIKAFAASLFARHPDLNVLVNNAGIMRAEDLLAEPADLDDAEATIATNLLGPIRLTAALLPHLRRQTRAAIVNVTSGLAFVPMANFPTYCATKAALHSYTQSLRFQLRDTAVQVIELPPPAVATDLTPDHATSSRSMPLDQFITQSMALLRDTPAAGEICVDRVRLLRTAEATGQFAKAFDMLNPRPEPIPG